jgi:hypothetical protein
VNRYQKIALAVAAANLLLILLFPPFDQYSIAASQVPVFIGFNFVLTPLPYSEINNAVLLLEVFVVLVNTGIALLPLRDKPTGEPKPRMSYQNAALIFTGVNLIVVLLFPPFESVFALTNAALPSFEGFYFIFTRHPSHTIVITLLYLEVIFILVNGALLWLIVRERAPSQLTREQIYTLAAHLRRKERK